MYNPKLFYLLFIFLAIVCTCMLRNIKSQAIGVHSVLLVGNCKPCRTNESRIARFPGTVMRFNGSFDGRTDVMVWSDDLLENPEGYARLQQLPRSIHHRKRSDFQGYEGDHIYHSTGFVVWKYLIERGHDVYCTGFNQGETISESTLRYGNQRHPHDWERELHEAKYNPKWKLF